MRFLRVYAGDEKIAGGYPTATISCADVTAAKPQWFLEIRKPLFDGGYGLVFNESYANLFSAERGLRGWRKGVKWTALTR